MEQGLQKDYDMIGEYGCYLLCIFEACSKTFTLEDYYRLQKLGYIDEECFVKNPAAIVKALTGKSVYVIKSDKPMTTRDDVFCRIERWYNPKHTHFVLHKDDGTIWDSLGKHHLKERGYQDIESYRIFIEVK